MKKNQILFYFLVLLITSKSFSQTSKNKFRGKIYASNGIKTTIKKDSLIKNKKWYNSSFSPNMQIPISFRNNPYNLDSTFNVLIILDNLIICDGKYSDNSLMAKVPNEILNTKLSPKLIICDNKSCFTFSCGQVLKTITNKDNLMHVIFMPTNNEETIYFITTNYNLNEN